MKADFDQAAKNYDSGFTFSEIGKKQRSLVYKQLQKPLANCKTILEINCGTGEDALWLHKQGFLVTATDVSEKMIAVAQAKSQDKNPIFKVLDIKKIAEDTHFFDMIFSNFGGLNCLSHSELVDFFANSHTILSQNGFLTLVIMPKNTLWEQFYFAFKFAFKKAFRRKNEFAIANVDGENVKTYYYNPQDIVNLAAANYKVVSVQPIGFFIPPSYLEPFFKNKKILLKGLWFLENSISSWSFLSKYADHYSITLQKK